MTIIAEFGGFIEACQSKTFAPITMHHARRALLDWQASLLAGSDTDAAKRLFAAYADELGIGHCSIAGSSQKALMRAAAFINGTVSHIAEFDDIYRDGAYHPAAPTISAVFALAEQRQDSLDQLLEAIIVGYEVSTRISRVIQPSHYRFFHTTGTVGVFGAAAACAYLLKLNKNQASDALASATTFASGLQQAFRSDSMTKPMHAGHAAQVGLNAALTAEAGMTGTLDILEGEAGFGAALSQNPRWEEVFEGLWADWNIEHMTFKNHGCCGHNFPSIDGVAFLMQTYPISFDNIEKIRVGGYKATKNVCCYVHPQSSFEAKFSLTYTVAAKIILGRVREKAFLSAALQDPRLQELEAKIELSIDPVCEAKFPVHRSAKVEIELKDGTVYAHHQQTRHGDPDDPLTDQELLDKFMELSEPRIGHERALQLANLIVESKSSQVRDLSHYWEAQ
jgi:2-methylcitrate dehydratase PrpD